MLHVSSNISCDCLRYLRVPSTCVTPGISRHTHPEGEPLYLCIYIPIYIYSGADGFWGDLFSILLLCCYGVTGA